ncbi:hypothetical protein CEXT_386441 [Caerostris extrusa]|uniref:Uncharacterized protein n=1 Tax=Caerostris extrusa TaxID=172846 RepID=A0AAV4W8H8_CAEEX|nr:hypothetical protein CEXT_386441 [Caerostris extrusa]
MKSFSAQNKRGKNNTNSRRMNSREREHKTISKEPPEWDVKHPMCLPQHREFLFPAQSKRCQNRLEGNILSSQCPRNQKWSDGPEC